MNANEHGKNKTSKTNADVKQKNRDAQESCLHAYTPYGHVPKPLVREVSFGEVCAAYAPLCFQHVVLFCTEAWLFFVNMHDNLGIVNGAHLSDY